MALNLGNYRRPKRRSHFTRPTSCPVSEETDFRLIWGPCVHEGCHKPSAARFFRVSIYELPEAPASPSGIRTAACRVYTPSRLLAMTFSPSFDYVRQYSLVYRLSKSTAVVSTTCICNFRGLSYFRYTKETIFRHSPKNKASTYVATWANQKILSSSS